MSWDNLPSKDEVLAQISQLWKPTPATESMCITKAANRILAESYYSAHNLPVFRASAMDGVGFSYTNYKKCSGDTSLWAEGKDYVRADTGDDFPDDFDTVIPIESVAFDNDNKISFSPDYTVEKEMNVRREGSFLKEGELLVEKYTKISPSISAVLVLGGITKVNVLCRPSVAFVPTGSELIPMGVPLTRGKNIDTNSIMAKQMIEEMGGQVKVFPIIPDDKKMLETTLKNALSFADIILLNGGSSKGEEDYNAALLKEKGKVLCHGAATAPGKPICVAIVDGKLIVNLPGPAIAAYNSIDWCVRAAVDMFLHQDLHSRKTIRCKLAEPISFQKGMEIFCKMEVWQEDDQLMTRQVPFRKSTIAANLRAPGKFITSPDKEIYQGGEYLEIELI